MAELEKEISIKCSYFKEGSELSEKYNTLLNEFKLQYGFLSNLQDQKVTIYLKLIII